VRPVRLGLVGFGTGGRYFHAPLIAAAPECELAGVVTRSADRRAELARAHPGVPAYDSLGALADADVEAVTICTPAATRVALTQEALGRGLAVVCDKPFAPDAGAARQTVELAERAGLVLTVYQNRRWDSDFLTVRRLVDDGVLGAVTRFESRFERFSPRGPRAAGGGGLLDFGTHLVDQALQLFGPVLSVYAEAHRREDLGGLEDDFFVALTHRGGVRSQLWGSWVQGAPGPRLRVTGTTGSYVVGGVDGQEDSLRAGRSPATEGDSWGVEPPERWGRVHRGEQTEVVPTQRGRWDTFYPAFAAAVRGLGPVPVDPRDAVACLAVLDAARRGAELGAVAAPQD
jgi:predicted dehydrogenase